MKFCKKSDVIEGLRLEWGTWDEMCEFADVGSLADGKPEGRLQGTTLQLCVPPSGPETGPLAVASQEQWIMKDAEGVLSVMTDEERRAGLQIIED